MCARCDADIRTGETLTNGAICVGDAEPHRLHPVEVPGKATLDAPLDQLIQPRHQHPRALFTEAKYLRRL
ncbi:hypothetical protein [Enemella dayhoffiae]|uniref:hypothetical protein n=1 Tax=Enemella dayhoffiae TaxID=2016507 RepID=UPI001E4A335A|nr:hypothetical protein [Enemella dayhoffiae]